MLKHTTALIKILTLTATGRLFSTFPSIQLVKVKKYRPRAAEKREAVKGWTASHLVQTRVSQKVCYLLNCLQSVSCNWKNTRGQTDVAPSVCLASDAGERAEDEIGQTLHSQEPHDLRLISQMRKLRFGTGRAAYLRSHRHRVAEPI